MSDARIDVACIGAVGVDFIVRPVRGLPRPGQLELTQSGVLHTGGSAANTAFSLARFGARVTLRARVGVDTLGDFFVTAAEPLGLAGDLIRDPSEATSSSVVLVSPDGERSFLHAIGCNAHFGVADVDLGALQARGVRVLHLAGYFVLPALEADGGASLAAFFARARALGMLTSLDCAWDPRARWGAALGKVLQHTDVFCPSLNEARAICALPDAAPAVVAERLLETGISALVAVTQGAEGCFIAARDGTRAQIPAPRVAALDGTGAGDAFIAGLLRAHLNGAAWLECARFGNAAGALCVQAIGATSGVTDWTEVVSLARAVEHTGAT